MGCLAEMTVAHPTSGSFGAYAEYYVSPLAGFLVRYAYWTCIVMGVGTEVTAIADYMQFWFKSVPPWIWILLFPAALIAINARSVSTFGSVEYWFSTTKVAAIVAFVALGAFVIWIRSDRQFGLHHLTGHGGFFPRGVWGTWVAVVISIFSYLSIEMIAVAAGVGAMFTWMMIFVTHYFFRRRRNRAGAPEVPFRMKFFPATTLLGAGLMLAVLLTTAFTEVFRMTLAFGIPFLALLVAGFYVRRRRRGAPTGETTALP